MVIVLVAVVTVVVASAVSAVVEDVVGRVKGFNCSTGLFGLFSENFPGALSVTDIYYNYYLISKRFSKQCALELCILQ